MITVKINFLNEVREKIETITNDILDQRDKYRVVVDEEEAEKLIEAIEGLRIAIETTELA